MRMDVRPLRTEEDYDWALAEIEQYFQHEPAPGTPRADRFDVLSALIAEYRGAALADRSAGPWRRHPRPDGSGRIHPGRPGALAWIAVARL